MPDSMHQPRDENGQFVSLRDYVERIFVERQRAHDSEHVLIDKALDKAQELREEALSQARQVIDQRLEKLNELRREVTDDRAKFVTIEKYEAETKPLFEFRSRALGFGALFALLSGGVGAIIVKTIGG
jgi:DNA polymerase III alpha subunit